MGAAVATAMADYLHSIHWTPMVTVTVLWVSCEPHMFRVRCRPKPCAGVIYKNLICEKPVSSLNLNGECKEKITVVNLCLGGLLPDIAQ